MKTNNLKYQAIIEICKKSQEIMNKRVKEVGLQKAIAEIEPYESMWKEYSEQLTKPVEIRNANFSGMLFKQAKFKNHNFIECNFSNSHWVFSFIEESNFMKSNFSGMRTVLFPFKNTNCSNCDFSNADIAFFDPFSLNNFENANFTNAKISSAHSFFKDEKLAPRAYFKNAIMSNCKLIIQREPQPQHNRSKRELKSLLDVIFSPEQLTVMHIDYGGKRPEVKPSRCFIATAVCGVNSEEVKISQNFRDTVLLNSVVGRLFIRIYYRISPLIILLIKDSPKAKYAIQNIIVRPIAKFFNRKNNIKTS